jgi:hypothetical protein
MEGAKKTAECPGGSIVNIGFETGRRQVGLELRATLVMR